MNFLGVNHAAAAYLMQCFLGMVPIHEIITRLIGDPSTLQAQSRECSREAVTNLKLTAVQSTRELPRAVMLEDGAAICRLIGAVLTQHEEEDE